MIDVWFDDLIMLQAMPLNGADQQQFTYSTSSSSMMSFLDGTADSTMFMDSNMMITGTVNATVSSINQEDSMICFNTSYQTSECDI